jgi:hypothetical protein
MIQRSGEDLWKEKQERFKLEETEKGWNAAITVCRSLIRGGAGGIRWPQSWETRSEATPEIRHIRRLASQAARDSTRARRHPDGPHRWRQSQGGDRRQSYAWNGQPHYARAGWGATVALSTSDPTLAQVPPTVSIAPGNRREQLRHHHIARLPSGLSAHRCNGGGVTKSFWMDLGSDPNEPPLLQSVALNPTSVAGGGTVTGTVFLSQPAPPGGQTSANFTVTTSPVSSSTQVTVTAFY